MNRRDLSSYVKSLRAAVQKAKKADSGLTSRDKNGDRYPLFMWLRCARVASNESRINYVMGGGRVWIQQSRVGVAREVASRINKRLQMTPAQYAVLVDLLATRYGGRASREDYTDTQMDSLHDSEEGMRLDRLLVSRSGLLTARSIRATINREVTDLLLMGHLYGAADKNFIWQLKEMR